MASQQSVHDAVVEALEAWVNRHPAPDTPVLSIAVSGQYSPRQLLCEVRDRSETGLQIEEMIETAVASKAYTLKQILDLFQSPGSTQSQRTKFTHSR